MKKTIFILCDGIGDRPIQELDNKTPLDAANTPNMDQLAEQGITGDMFVMGEGVVPHSEDAHFTLFSYNLEKDFPGRGPLEAAGVGIELQEGDVAWRCNVATVDENLIVKDRRAGRVESTVEWAKKFNGTKINNIEFIVKPGTGYRMVIVMRGKGLSANVTSDDPKEVGKKVLQIKPTDNTDEAKFTADVMNKFLEKTHQELNNCEENKQRKEQNKLDVNYLLVRGAGFHKKYNLLKKNSN